MNCSIMEQQECCVAKLVVYKGVPHGMCTTGKDRVNAELLSFING
jgi:non-heme chloroperoxidase